MAVACFGSYRVGRLDAELNLLNGKLPVELRVQCLPAVKENNNEISIIY